MKTNMNIVVKSNVRALKGLGVSPRVFQTSQICDTHAYFHHLITCANQKHIGSGNTRFFCFTCYAFKQQKQCLWCIITSSRGFFFYGKSPGVERKGSRGNVATFMLGSLWVSRAVTVNSGVAYFRIGEYLWGRRIGERIDRFWKYFCPVSDSKGDFNWFPDPAIAADCGFIYFWGPDFGLCVSLKYFCPDFGFRAKC